MTKLYQQAIEGDDKFALQVETLAFFRERVFAELTKVLPDEHLSDTLRVIQQTTLPYYARPK